jgi:membrane-bound metal-dependent hydrolase YbcI (DUF457 family)
MDPVSHGVIGRAVVAASGRHFEGRGAGAAAVLGALSPDIDFVLMPFGWDIYLRAHVAGTHSIPGAIITGLGSAVLIRLCVRHSVLRQLCGAAVIGALTHLAGDIVSGARLQPAWPIVTQAVSLPLVAMADPWTIAIVLAGACAMWMQRQQLAHGARLAIAALGVFLMVKAVLLAATLSTLDRGADGGGTGGAGISDAGSPEQVVEARWASFTEWFVFDRRGSQLRQRLISLLPTAENSTTRQGEPGQRNARDIRVHEPKLIMAIDLPVDDELTHSSKSLQSVRNFLAVHHLVFPVERTESDGTRSVLWSDIRFCWRSGDDVLPSCALWFGGTFDGDGRPVRQTVHVGSWIQQRAP